MARDLNWQDWRCEMNAQWFNAIGLFTALAVIGAVVLLTLVYRDLGRESGLGRHGRRMLTAGLGLGVLAFASKVMAIAVMVSLPEATLTPLAGVHQRQPAARTLAVHNPKAPSPPLKPHYVWEALPSFAPAPADSPSTPDKVALGERLFHDKNLSRDRQVSCASCHDVLRGAGIDGLAASEGIGGQIGKRNAPTVWNAAFQSRLFLDGRAPSLEEQAKGPPLNPIEMGLHSLAEVETRVAESASYRAAFARVFDGEQPLNIDNIVAAIAAYERGLITPDTPYDRFVRGDRQALNAAQLRGMDLFESTGCVVCHLGPNFSSASLFDTRAPYRVFPAFDFAELRRYRLGDDPGRARVGDRRGLWRVPSLRNVALTAPYFHNGSVNKLEDAVRIMAAAQLGRTVAVKPGAATAVRWSPVDRSLHRVVRRELTQADVDDIAAFLRALSSERLAAGLRGKIPRG